MTDINDKNDRIATTIPGNAQRALAEARARREAEPAPNRPGELGGRKGPEPTRFGDWEKDGIVSDF